MMVTTVFRMFRSFAVQAKYQSAVIVFGLVTFIAAYHYARIFNSWVDAYDYSTGSPKLTGVPFNDIYAMKAMSKRRIVAESLKDTVANEKACLELIDSDFVVRLVCTYRDKENVYLLMQPCLGGELFDIYSKHSELFGSERHCIFYAACTALGLEHMHARWGALGRRGRRFSSTVRAGNQPRKSVDFTYVAPRHTSATAGSPSPQRCWMLRTSTLP